VIVLIGDGSLLMNLGTLVTIAAARATNLTVVVLDNGVYEVTGGQKTAAALAPVDFAALACAAGIPSVRSFRDLDTWRDAASSALSLPGPRCLVLAVEPVLSDFHLESPGPMGARMATFVSAVQASEAV
jgi:phosphonopyruvate decarboxylase